TLYLVALQMADEVPADVQNGWGSSPKLLRPTLTKVTNAELRQERRDFDGDRLRHGNHGDSVARAACAGASSADALFSELEMGAQQFAGIAGRHRRLWER